MKEFLFLITITLLLSGCSLSLTDEYDDSIFKDYSKPWETEPVEDENESIPKAQGYNYSQPIDDSDYRIGSFNIQIFGQKKANSNVMPTIEDIIDDYDILAIQEVRDSTGTVIGKLNDIDGYHIRVSPRLGRTKSKEQYVFFYSDRVVPGKSLVYPDEDDVFEREPYVMNFRINSQDMTFIQVHIKPTDAEQEIRHLYDVVEWTYENFGDDNIYIMGDLNADCVYFSSFYVLDEWQILIDEDNDTTVGRSDCAYDRILATEIDPKVLQVGVDTFEEEVNGDMELLEAISDHYSVYFMFERDTLVDV